MSIQPDNQAKASRKVSWTRGEKWLLGMIMVGLVAGIATWAGINSLEKMPVLKIPTRNEPSPNGYEYLVSAGKAATEGPGVTTTRLTGSQAPSHPEQWLVQPPSAATIAADRPAASKNSSALALLCKGLSLPIMAPEHNDIGTPDWAGIRHLARATRDTAYVQASQGSYTLAADTALNGLAMGERMIRGGDVIDLLVGIACQELGRRAIWPTVAHLDAKSARGAAQRVASIDLQATPFSEILTEEKWAEQKSLMKTFQKKSWRADLVSGSDPDGTVHEDQVRSLALVSKRALMNAYTTRMDAAIAMAGGQFHAYAPPPSSGIKFVDDNLVIANSNTWFVWLRKAADTRLLAAALALRAYHLDHGAYPASLEALTPTYLPSVPQDPFGSVPLKYKVTGSGYSLYSIGPDGIDDGGKPVDTLGNNRNRYQLSQTSHGDILAGLNE